ncbi:MAG: DUF268 domain-containing protein [bacterium]|nr:DUF268 domain-containing protein [bacterium]
MPKLPAKPPPQQRPMMDLAGDRDIEWTWVAAQFPMGPGRALDFGCGHTPLAPTAALRGFDTLGVDLQEIRRPFLIPNLRYVLGDINLLPLAEKYFDLIINCSTVEHVGVVGRYDVTVDDPDGDLTAMRRLRMFMKQDAIHIMTIPVGVDTIWRPLHRIYGKQRLPLLLKGYRVEYARYWVKDDFNRWVPVPEETALTTPTAPALYGLGCFVLKRDDAPESVP